MGRRLSPEARLRIYNEVKAQIEKDQGEPAQPGARQSMIRRQESGGEEGERGGARGGGRKGYKRPVKAQSGQAAGKEPGQAAGDELLHSAGDESRPASKSQSDIGADEVSRGFDPDESSREMEAFKEPSSVPPPPADLPPQPEPPRSVAPQPEARRRRPKSAPEKPPAKGKGRPVESRELRERLDMLTASPDETIYLTPAEPKPAPPRDPRKPSRREAREASAVGARPDRRDVSRPGSVRLEGKEEGGRKPAGSRKPAEAGKPAESIALFTGLDERSIERVSAQGTEQIYPAGQPIYRQGDPAIGCFVLLSGSVEVRRELTNGEKQLYTVGRGETFGESDLASAAQWRQAGAFAVETARCLEFSGNPLEMFHDDVEPRIARRLLRNEICLIARRLRQIARAEGRAEADGRVKSHIRFDEMTDTVAFLRRYLSPKFESEVMRKRWIEPGELQPRDFVYKAGSPSDGFFLIRRGTIEIRSRSRNGRERASYLSGPSILGEVSFFSGRPRSVTASAIDRVSVLHFPGERYHKLRKTDEKAALDLLMMTAELSCGLLQSRETMYG